MNTGICKAGIAKFNIFDVQVLAMTKTKKIHKNTEWLKDMSGPGIWNLTGYKKAWKSYPKDLDFLSKKSGHYHIKALEREIYLEILKPFLKSLKRDSVILDAACGIGRFAKGLAKQGHKIYMVDACETNLEKAIAHLEENEAEKNTELFLGDISNLPMFADGTFDMILGIEAICYCSNPESALKELARVAKKGGIIIISVEGKYGSIIADENVSAKYFGSAYSNSELRIKDHTFTKYFSKEELEETVKKAGIEILLSQGCMYVPNGIFHRLVDLKKLGGKKYRNKLLQIEKLCGSDPLLSKLARVWIVIGKVKK